MTANKTALKINMETQVPNRSWAHITADLGM